MERTIRRAGWAAAGALIIALIAALASVVYGGPLDPPAGVSTSTSTQEQLIFQPSGACPAGFPITISAPGSYKLAENIVGCPGVDGVTVAAVARGVTLDLNGFSIIGPGGAGTENAISASGDFITIRNGTIREWGGNGVTISDNDSSLTNLTLEHNGFNGGGGATGWGINVLSGVRVLVSDSMLTSNGAPAGGGISVGSVGEVRDCLFHSNTGVGIAAGSQFVITGNHVVSSAEDIKATSFGNRIAGNNVSGASIGIHVTGSSNTIIQNSAGANLTNYVIGAGNTTGAIGPVGTPPGDPWGNIQY